MSLAHIVVTGKVTKAPEKRFTQNNLAITSFVVDVNAQDETLVRVFAMGNLAERAAEILQLGDEALISGRLQTSTVKSTSGRDRKIMEINASTVDKISVLSQPQAFGGQGNQASFAQNSNYQTAQRQQPQASSPAVPGPQPDIVQFGTDEISEDLIDEDEIPF